MGIATTAALGVCEGLARYTGARPTPRRLSPAPWVAFDPELGWTNRPNSRIRWGRGDATFLGDGSRRTRSSSEPPSSDEWLLLGCSYTQGFGLPDSETFAWKLQARYPNVTLTNFGTGGYGTYQSLLRFRRERRRRPTLVIYGFGDFQGWRDVAARAWMHSTGEELPFVPPHVEVVDGKLLEHPLMWLPRYPLESRSALVHLGVATYLDRTRYAADNEVAIGAAQRAVLQEFRREVEQAGARFLVANLWMMPALRDGWRAWFQHERFDVADCVTPDLPFDHPDETWSRHHAACIASAIDASLNF